MENKHDGRQVILYIAMSLDGYIADKNGGVHWLMGDGSDSENKGSYPEFYETIDTVILGYKTYDQVANELFPDHWIYDDRKSYVFTHHQLPNTKLITFTDEEPVGLIEKLKKEEGKDIWICGGASIVNQLLKSDMIDTFCFSIIPTILGEGISLFHHHGMEKKLKLVSTRTYDGIVDLVYKRRL
ncbi:dihydrofolate reductase family protein [Absiella sp. AM29-15]|uniref:dihydrofolate reductase family protein n=1 Tax=Absiella sp. AM29-15 TaxID=2292278 RepID=UPI000E416A89|nr:dihydrofolate reductase family protein [Absiella sp. AM29-15]RGC51889.1 dihydrofolate reductase [Absiella sp. AM29-15]